MSPTPIVPPEINPTTTTSGLPFHTNMSDRQTPSALKSTSNSSSRNSHRESLSLNRAPPSPRLNAATANRSSSLTENFRHPPLSPRAHRSPSMSQSAIQDLLNDPPSAKSRDPAFTGRDWKTVRVEEVVDEGQVRFVDMTTSVEKATEVLHSLTNRFNPQG